MKNKLKIKSKLIKVVVTVAVALGLTVGAAEVAHAGAYTGQTTCATAVLGNRICIDISSNSVAIYSDNTTVWASTTMGPLVDLGGGLPSNGWIAYDFECNASGSTTTFQTGSAYNLNSSYVSFYPAPNSNHGWNSAPLDGTFASYVAWFANSNSGFECVVVP